MRGHAAGGASGGRGQPDISSVDEGDFVSADVREAQQAAFLRLLGERKSGEEQEAENDQGGTTANEGHDENLHKKGVIGLEAVTSGKRILQQVRGQKFRRR